MKGIESVCAKGGADNEASNGQHLVRRACGRGRDIYSNNEAIKKGVQVNHPAAPARGSWVEHCRCNEEEQEKWQFSWTASWSLCRRCCGSTLSWSCSFAASLAWGETCAQAQALYILRLDRIHQKRRLKWAQTEMVSFWKA